LPDTLSSFLSGSPFVYTVAIAPPEVSGGEHIGPAAISRNNFSFYLQDTWKVSSRFTLDYGIRWDLYQPITERAHRTSSFLTVNGLQEFVINPQPGYQTNWNAWEPRVQATWQVSKAISAHAGGSIMVIPPNIWQDNFLTGSTPFAVYPRLLSASNAPIPYGFKLTPAQLPKAYTPAGADILAGATKTIAPNTVMDVNRYEQDVAALTKGHVVSDLNLSGIDRSFGNATLYTWTVGLERKFGNLTGDASYVGTAGEKLPRSAFPTPIREPARPLRRTPPSIAMGNVTGGFGVENVIAATLTPLITRCKPRSPEPWSWRARHSGELHLGQVNRRHQSGYDPDFRRIPTIAPGERSVVLRRDPRLRLERGPGSALGERRVIYAP
jgi:hypothetical protein